MPEKWTNNYTPSCCFVINSHDRAVSTAFEFLQCLSIASVVDPMAEGTLVLQSVENRLIVVDSAQQVCSTCSSLFTCSVPRERERNMGEERDIYIWRDKFSSYSQDDSITSVVICDKRSILAQPNY